MLRDFRLPALTLALLLAACAGPSQPAASPTDVAAPASPAPTTDEQPGATPTSQPDAGEATADPPTEAPPALPDDPWRTAELRDVRSGETLVINELIGRLVVIEPMAIWCISCRQQQNEVREALANLSRDDIVYISLDVDPNETEADLAVYADQRDYPWHFVVASREVARSLAQSFGDQVLSPPSTPEIIVAPDGSTSVSFGIKRAAELEAQFSSLLP